MLIAIARGARICLFGMLLIVMASPQARTTLTRAAVTVEATGSSAGFAAADVTLPYNWDAIQGGVNGQARFVLQFAVDDPTLPHALFISRIGNTFRLELNGTTVAAKGDAFDPYADFAKQPQFFTLPQQLLRTNNTLVISIDAQGGRRAGLSEVTIGTADEVRALFKDAYRWRVRGFLALATISAVLGCFALLLWLRQREILYVIYAVSELSWALLLSDTLLEHTPLPWPWWGLVVFSAYVSSASLACRFSLMLVERCHGVLKRLSDGHLLLSLPIVAIAMLGRIPLLLSIWLGVTLMLCITTAVVVVVVGLRSHTFEKRLLAVAVIATCIAATRDMIVFRILPGYGGIPWVRYAWVAFGITLAWIIAERMRQSTLAIADMNRTLMQRLAAREAELKASYALQAEVERNHAMIEERQRLTRDMHDGLGSQLLGALHLAQNPAVSKEALTEQLRDTLDQLKLTVDAMQDTEGDIAALLGALRYRLGPRLDAAGVRLIWSVEQLPTMGGWTLQHSRNMQMILFEAFSNIIAHAEATQAHLSAVLDEQQQHVCITLQDNGKGFHADEDRRGGNGLANMQTRAARMGAELHIESVSSGTRVRLSLPVNANAAV